MTRSNKGLRLATDVVHAGEVRPFPHHALTLPILETATYTFENTADLRQFMDARMWGLAGGRVEYGRYGNPTVSSVEAKLSVLEAGQAAVLFSSGMAAVTTALLSLLYAGDHIVITDDSYRRTRQFCLTFLKRWSIECSVVSAGNLEQLEGAIRSNTKVIVSESPTNPYLRVMDLKRLVAIAERHKVKTLIDSTFATPINQRPLEFGIDLVVDSATKYLGGHNDLLAGVVAGSESLMAMIRQNLWVLGAVCDPQTAYLIQRGLKTLSLRVEQQNESAQKVAEFLEAEPGVRRVWYPGLRSHPDHEVARQQMEGYGGVVSFELDGDLEATSRFIDAVQLPLIASSLGGVETLIEQPALMSYYELSSEERELIGIKDNLVRLSIGIESPDDLIADLALALQFVR
ncbi:MAG: trans-sulfuration enzyme family protein [Anaerolineales bacterium]